ncbi:hypothetical protein C8R44DRAFT_864752 [Mycena epipterygia]|nr:hypothetical protein C8R44DRAFT_864752 [Mycena epipterygia]
MEVNGSHSMRVEGVTIKGGSGGNGGHGGKTGGSGGTGQGNQVNIQMCQGTVQIFNCRCGGHPHDSDSKPRSQDRDVTTRNDSLDAASWFLGCLWPDVDDMDALAM